MFALVAVSLAWCAIKFNAPTVPELTGEILTWTESTGVVVTGSEMEEFTWEFDAGDVPTVDGSDDVSTDTGVVAEVDDLIEDRDTQPKDDTKLTEEDIDLMQQIIDKVQGLGN